MFLPESRQPITTHGHRGGVGRSASTLAQVEGLLVSQSIEHVCLILTHSALVLSAEHVVAIETLDLPSTPSGLKAVRVEYRDDASVSSDMNSSAAMDASRVDNTLPFALAIRRGQPRISDSPRYRHLAMSFLRQHGLIGHQGADDCGIGA